MSGNNKIKDKKIFLIFIIKSKQFMKIYLLLTRVKNCIGLVLPACH